MKLHPMSSPLFHVLLPLLLLLQLQPLSANLYNTNLLSRSLDAIIPQYSNELTSASPKNATVPTTFFEVTSPIQLPNTKPLSYLILQHDFASTYGKPPVFANYTPPADFPAGGFEKIVMEWTATCKGRQFDRILGVWIGGVEIFRSCTAEPRPNGIVWTVSKDITRYSSLLKSNQTVAVYLQNIVDSTYTGVYHVNVSFHFYPAEEKKVSLDGFNSGPADLILPISRNLPVNDGLWFDIQNSTDFQSKEFEIPQNVYRAVLEVYVSYHENDEFWYTNMYNDYIAANNLTVMQGNGPFREVEVSLDGVTAGSVWPFPVIYTGGVNPLLWRPISGIGSFDLPSYNIEITPFLGNLLDAKTHSFGFKVTNALNVWYIDANLHLWLDGKSQKTEGKLTEHVVSPLAMSLVSKFKGFDGTFDANVSRIITSSGWVKSSYGTTITKSIQVLNYTNFMAMENDANRQTVNQVIDYNDKVVFKFKNPSSASQISISSLKNFPLYVYTDVVDPENTTYTLVSNVSRGFNENKKMISDHRVAGSSLRNFQVGSGTMVVKGNLVVGGLGSEEQNLIYNDNKSCYFRNISASNYTILYDHVRDSCSKMKRLHLGNGLGLHRLI